MVKSEPPVWFCDVGGRRVELTTDDLQTPQRFQSCMEQIHVMPPMMKMADWRRVVSMLMDGMSEIDVPEELTYKGQFMDLLERSVMVGYRHNHLKRSHLANPLQTMKR